MTPARTKRRQPPAVFEAASTSDPFQLLAAEHALLRLQMARAILAARRGTDAPAAREAIVALANGLRTHQRREDLVMYPVCERLFNGPDGVAAVLRDDHVEIAQAVGGLRRHPPSGSAALAAVLGDLHRLLEVHFVREERVLFPLMTAYLPGKESAELARRLRASPNP